MAAVGGCCARADSAAADDAAVLESAAPIAAVGGCCPFLLPAAPAVGPAPASRAANSLERLSISVVHGPAAAISIGKASRAQVPTRSVIVFMMFLPVKIGIPARGDLCPLACQPQIQLRCSTSGQETPFARGLLNSSVVRCVVFQSGSRVRRKP